VGDEDDGAPARLQLAHDREQLLALTGGENRCRLVEDQHLGVPDQGLDDLHPLLHADRELFDQGIGVDAQPVTL
jgi:hypothetical protein